MVSRLDSMLIQNRLADLSASQDGIQALSSLFIKFHEDVERIVNIWFERFKEATAKKRLTYMYLCNDIVQTCKHTPGADVYKDHFKYVLKDISELVSGTQIQSKIERIYAIWCERNIYEHDFTDELVAILNNRPKSEYNEVKLKTEEELPEFEIDIVIGSIDNFLKLSDEVETKRRKLVCCSVDASDVDKMIPVLKDRESANAFQVQFEDSYICMNEYVQALEKDIEQRVTLIDSLHSAQKYYTNQYKDARIIMGAYKNFTRRVKKQDHRVRVHMRNMLRRKQQELRRLQREIPDSPKDIEPVDSDVQDSPPTPSSPPPPPPSQDATPPDDIVDVEDVTHQPPSEGHMYTPHTDGIEPIISDNEEDMDLSDGDSPVMISSSPIQSPISLTDVRSFTNDMPLSEPLKSFMDPNDIENGATADSILTKSMYSSSDFSADKVKPMQPPLAPPSMPDILKKSSSSSSSNLLPPPPPPSNYGLHLTDVDNRVSQSSTMKPPTIPFISRMAHNNEDNMGGMQRSLAGNRNNNEVGGNEYGGQCNLNMNQSDHSMGRGNPNMGMGNPNMGRSNPNMGRGDQNMGRGNQNMGRGNQNMGRGDQNMGRGDQNMGRGNQNMGRGDQNMIYPHHNMNPNSRNSSSNQCWDGNRDMYMGQGNRDLGHIDGTHDQNDNLDIQFRNDGEDIDLRSEMQIIRNNPTTNENFRNCDSRMDIIDPRRANRNMNSNDPRLVSKQMNSNDDFLPPTFNNNKNNISRIDEDYQFPRGGGMMDCNDESMNNHPREHGNFSNAPFLNQNNFQRGHRGQRGQPY